MLKENDFVKHTKFGFGKVLELYGTKKDPRAKIFFVGEEESDPKDVGEKTMMPNIPSMSILNDEELETLYKHADFILLDTIGTDSDTTHYKNIYEAIKGFKKELNTEDFNGEFYLKDERAYKVHFHEVALAYFNQRAFEALLEQNEYETLFSNLKKVFASRHEGFSQNLTDNRFETPKFYDALASHENKTLFFKALFDLLYGDETFEIRFTNWVDTLKEIEFAKWTIATIFLFIIYPDTYMFVKPNTTKNALEVTGFSVKDYNSVPHYRFYSKILTCSKYIFEKTKEAGLNPKDMIDVQSFMWCIRPEYDNDDRAYQDKETRV